MNSPKITTKPFGAHAILVEWPSEVNEDILECILRFETFLRKDDFLPQEWELVPSYNSLLIINRNISIDFDELSKHIHGWYDQATGVNEIERFLWRLPVSYELEYGLDLEAVANSLNVSIDEVIALHTGATYTVYGIGFLPGFMYLGGVDKKLQLPRKAVPRLKVLKGAVGVAGEQAGIYPQESPGGWNIIGSCPVPIFDVERENPCFVKVGDKIQFYQVSAAAYELHQIEIEVGIYNPEKIKINA